MKGKKWLSVLIAGVMVLVAAPLSVPVQAADNPTVTVNSMKDTVAVGDTTEFSVTTSGTYSGNVLGKFELTAGDSSAVTLEYYETAAGYEGWHKLAGNTFGPAAGFPYYDGATSQFRVTFAQEGTYTFAVKIVKADDQNHVVAETSASVTVNKPDVVITDCGPWGETWPGAYNLGWKYVNGFNTDNIASIRAGMMDKKERIIVEYTADAEQIKWQKGNSYITSDGVSSAPFYKEYNGQPMKEGRDDDWTATFGPGFYAWQPSLFYVEVTTNSEEVYYRTMAYEGNFECIHEFAEHVAKKAPTCTEPGNIEYWYCPECDKFFSDAALQNSITPDDTILATLGHDAVKVDAKKPTADKDGNIEYWYCKTCGKYFSDKDLTKEISKEDTILKATGSKTDKKDGVPVTGDSTNMMLWVAVLALAAGVTVYAGKKARS